MPTVCTGSSEVRHQFEVPEFIATKQTYSTHYVFLNTQVIQYNHNRIRENSDEIVCGDDGPQSRF